MNLEALYTHGYNRGNSGMPPENESIRTAYGDDALAEYKRGWLEGRAALMDRRQTLFPDDTDYGRKRDPLQPSLL